MIGPDIVKDIEAKVQVIRQRLKAASDRRKSYADLKRKDIEYEVGDKVFLKVLPWRKVLIFGKKWKLSLRFIGPYEVLERIGPVAYRLALPLELAKFHDVFCHAPDPGPTRLVNPNRFQGAKPYAGTPYFFFFQS